MRDLQRSVYSVVISVTLVFSSLFSVSAQAAMVSSESAIAEHVMHYDREMLLAAFHEKGVQDQLAAMGVDAASIEQRVQRLTPRELAKLNAEIQTMPAGQGAAGILLTIFVVFVITDVLCATNIFSFINCIR